MADLVLREYWALCNAFLKGERGRLVDDVVKEYEPALEFRKREFQSSIKCINRYETLGGFVRSVRNDRAYSLEVEGVTFRGCVVYVPKVGCPWYPDLFVAWMIICIPVAERMALVPIAKVIGEFDRSGVATKAHSQKAGELHPRSMSWFSLYWKVLCWSRDRDGSVVVKD
jgi:hypothetical protein